MKFEKISEDFYQSKNFSMSVDFKNKKFSYPKNLKINRDNLKNFSQNENFVVFECIHRLLQKGYQPEDIEIEKSWNLGHTPKSGRADICISKNEKVFLIIECKTFGTEFKNELENLKSDGGQLFSYWQQENSCQWLVLYASNFDGEKIIFDSKSVSCNEENYKNAPTVQEKFKIWSEIFQKKLADDVIFHEDTVAYKIGVKPFRKKDLKDFNDTKIINFYEEILRHNSVTNKQNAFDALLELFICKLADESQKNFDDEVDFQFKFGADTFEIFIDRLQKLYHEGMEKFMRIETTYTPLSVVENLLEQNQGKNRKNLENLFKKEFNKLKFYTPNIFNFIKVLNPEIFYMNTKVVREVVELFKNYQIIGAKNLQTLGDMFEQLLDKGFKQDEGQFFTPLPITKFIWNCLPLEKIISAEKNFTPPKIIDYACGAGHFLTQGFETINNFAKNLPKGWEDEKIFGIEKNDRLSTVSKISFFMHGADKGKIKFGDGLENYPDEGISAESFDILVSNPPYSVKNFKKFLQIKNKFETLEKISKNGNEIETLFVERISQLLKPGGIAAVILPSSILNKDGKSFVCAREKILQNFYVRAIAEFGSKTFSATGTKTNILFLEKISPSEKFKIFEDTANIIFENNFSDEWNDEKIFSAWLAKNKIEKIFYQKFITRENDFFDWKNDAYFGEYFTKFVDMTRSARDFLEKYGEIIFAYLKFGKNNFCVPKIPELENLNRKFYDFAHEIEKEKIQYFAQTFTQTTLIISAPDDNSAQEKFLGYKWSNRKGDEGIKITGAGILNELATAVKKSFLGEKISLPTAQKYFYYLNLADMIDFSGANFSKIIKLTKKIKVNYSGKFPLKRWEEVLEIRTGRDYKSVKNPEGKFPVYGSGGIISRADDFICPENSVVIGRKGTINKPIFVQEKFWNIDTAFGVIANEKFILPEFLFYFCLQFNFESLNQQLTLPSLARKDLYKILMPVPSIEEQKKIISEFKLIDEKISAQEKIISDGDLKIKNKFTEMFGGFEKNILFSKICIDDTRNGEKIPAADYLTEGKIQIIDQSINEIAGYSNFEKNFYENLPCIIFGDHTEIFKFVREKFFLGADGTKILIPSDRNKIDTIFLFYMLKFEHKTTGGYSRHFRNLNSEKFYLPPKEIQEKFSKYVFEVESEKNSAIELKKILEVERENLVEKYFK